MGIQVVGTRRAMANGTAVNVRVRIFVWRAPRLCGSRCRVPEGALLLAS